MHLSRNLWPYGIIAAFALFLSGTAGLVVLACAHKSDLVSRDYYEEEVRFQSHLDRADRARNLATRASVVYDPATRRITLSFPLEPARGAARGRVQLYRPSEAGLDRQVELRVDANGVQTIDAADLKSGLWKVKVTWSAGGEDYFLDEKIVIGAKPS
jgi:nitrogen fixation protein FixH